MTKISNAERRLHPRVEQELPVKIIANGYDFATTTKNISCLGAYCRISKYVPPFTRVAIRLNLPMVKKQKEADLECRGVVVRTEDEADGGFNVAIFFNGIQESQKQKISQYLSQFLP